MKAIGTGLLFVLLSFCGPPKVAAQPRPVPVVDASTPIVLGDVWVKPPGISDWFLVDKSVNGVLFVKRLQVRLHSFYVAALVKEFPLGAGSAGDLFALMRDETRKRADGGGRFKTVSVEFGDEEERFGTRCSRYDFSSEDHAARGAEGKVLLLSASGLICMLPNSPNKYLDIHYSERGGPNETSAALRKEGEGFMHSVVIQKSN